MRTDLVIKLLKGPVTYSDVKKHKLMQEEVGLLYNQDYVSKKEFAHTYKREHYWIKNIAKASHMQWQRQRRYYVQNRDKLLIMREILRAYKSNGISVERIEKGLEHGIPVKDLYATPQVYVREFLGETREELCNRTLSIKQVCRGLGLAQAQVYRRLAKGTLERCEITNRVRKKSVIRALKEQIFSRLEAIKDISEEDYKKFTREISLNDPKVLQK